MVIWVWLHSAGILSIDSVDFMKWNLWLSYFAGTQASIVLMSSARQSYLDREKQEKNFKVDQKTLRLSKINNDRILEIMEQIDDLEDILDVLIEDKENKSANGHDGH